VVAIIGALAWTVGDWAVGVVAIGAIATYGLIEWVQPSGRLGPRTPASRANSDISGSNPSDAC